jgi:hypothetical protein
MWQKTFMKPSIGSLHNRKINKAQLAIKSYKFS